MKYFLSQKININEINIDDKYNDTVKSTIFSYFYKIQNKENATYSSLKRIFGNLWIGEKSVDEIIFKEPTSWRDKEDFYRKRGIKAFYKFHESFKNDIKYPILINHDYEVKINKNLTIKGTIDLIREDNGDLELLDIRTGDTVSENSYINKNLRIISSCYAFEKLFDIKLKKVYSYGFDKNSLTIISKNNDYAEFEKAIINIAKCIYNNLIYVSPGSHCIKCAYKNKCRI